MSISSLVPRMTLHRRQQMWAYIFLLVPLTFYLVIRFWPALNAFNISLRDYNPLSPVHPFVGLANYEQIFNELMNPRTVTHKAFVNTFMYVFLGMPTQLVIGLGLALLLHRITKMVGLYRALYFLPYVTSTVAIAWVWRWLYQPQFGLFNQTLGLFGLSAQPFLLSTTQALPSVTAVAVWQGLGFTVIIFLAGLKQIPEMYYEAAEIDGANRWQLFRHVTLPLLNPTIVFLAVLQTISFLRMFAVVINITRQGDGGPLSTTTTVVLRVYREAFSSLNMGYAASMTVVLFVIILAITLFQLKVLSRRIDY